MKYDVWDFVFGPMVWLAGIGLLAAVGGIGWLAYYLFTHLHWS